MYRNIHQRIVCLFWIHILGAAQHVDRWIFSWFESAQISKWSNGPRSVQRGTAQQRNGTRLFLYISFTIENEFWSLELFTTPTLQRRWRTLQLLQAYRLQHSFITRPWWFSESFNQIRISDIGFKRANQFINLTVQKY
jgi:hypothetical protein